MKNSGVRNEYIFIEKINNKKIQDLNFLLQELILFLFPNIKSNTIIKCYKNMDYEKPDIVIKVGYIKKYISIKMGKRNSVHCESIKKFKKFLESLKISEQTMNEIFKYHYGDGTINGTGKHRKSSIEYKKNNKNAIKHVNQELNNKEIINKAINRFIIQGTQEHTNKIDLLVYGTPDDFFFITPNEIHSYIQSKKEVESTAIHFSCLTFQPMARVLDYDEKKEYMRQWIQIKWYNLEDNIIEIMDKRIQNILNN